MLVFDPNARVNTDGTSETARNDLSHAIGLETVVKVGSHSGRRTSHHKNDHISLNIEDIRFGEENSFGVSPLTLGIGMTFLHELNHTSIVPSGGTEDKLLHDWDKGPTVVHMNRIRDEISNSGRHRMGARQSYNYRRDENGNVYYPFSDDLLRRVYRRMR